MAERLLRAQPVSVANHVKARRSLIERSVRWLAVESGWVRSKRSAIFSGKLSGGFIMFGQCCPCGAYYQLTGLVQRIFNSNNIQDSVLLQKKVPNMSLYKLTFCVVVYTSYKMLKWSVCFSQPCTFYRLLRLLVVSCWSWRWFSCCFGHRYQRQLGECLVHTVRGCDQHELSAYSETIVVLQTSIITQLCSRRHHHHHHQQQQQQHQQLEEDNQLNEHDGQLKLLNVKNWFI